jgi:hypothetical protein
MENREWKKMFGSIAAALVFGVLCAAAIAFIDGMSGGFAIAFVSLFLSISCLTVSGLFFQRARLTDAILRGDRILAHWVYPEADVHRSIEREYTEYRERNRALILIMGGMIVAVALFFLIFAGEGGVVTAAVLFVLFLILFIVSRVTPGLERNRALHASHETFITRDGIIYEGGLYPFRSFLMRMEGAAFHEETRKQPAALEFSFLQMVGLYILNPFEITIPVPEGQEERAREIAAEIRQAIRHKM